MGQHTGGPPCVEPGAAGADWGEMGGSEGSESASEMRSTNISRVTTSVDSTNRPFSYTEVVFYPLR